MKALTICQPWAFAIAAGHKRVENRTWNTHHRGPLAIHAGLSRRWMQDGTEFIYELGITVPDDLTFGAIVAVADLIDVVKYSEAPQLWIDQLQSDPFADGPYCWLLENVKRLETPIPISGKQGLWNLPAEVEAQLLNIEHPTSNIQHRTTGEPPLSTLGDRG